MRVAGFALLVLLLAAVSARAQTIDNLGTAAPLTGTENVPIFQTANPALKTTTQAISNLLLRAVNIWDAVQTFTMAPVFTDAPGSRTALGLGTSATRNTGTNGATVPLLNGANTWSGHQDFNSDVYFGSGRPTCDPRYYGAVGDGATDDSAAFQQCVAQLNSTTGGILKVPASNNFYCLKTADPAHPSSHAAIVISSTQITLDGAGPGSTSLATCGADIGVIYASVFYASVSNMSVIGKGGPGNPSDSTFGATYPAIKFDNAGSGCGLCKIEFVIGSGGTYAFDDNGFDTFISDYSFTSSYGNAIMRFTGNGARLGRGATDQNFPLSYPPANTITLSARANTTVYGAGFTASVSGTTLTVSAISGGTLKPGQQINGAGVTVPTHIVSQSSGSTGGTGTYVLNQTMTVGSEAMTANGDLVTSGGYVIQLTGAGPCTSGGALTLQNYGTNITDGGCTWQLVGGTNYSAILLDGGSGEITGESLDVACGGCTYGISANNISGGVDPHTNSFSRLTIGQPTTSQIYLHDGTGFTIDQSHIGGCSVSGCSDIAITGTFSDGAHFFDNLISGGASGISVGVAATNTIISGNGISSVTTAGINITAAAIGGTITGNVFSGNGLSIKSSAVACDYLTIVGNTVSSGGTVSNACTGIHNVIANNSGYQNPLLVTLNAAALPTPPTGSVAQFGQTDAVGSLVTVDGFAGTPGIAFRRADTTAANPSAVQINETMGTLSVRGYGSTAYTATNRGSISFFAAENWTDALQGTYVSIATTTTGTAGVGTERVRIGGANALAITGTSTFSDTVTGAARVKGSVLSTNGFTVSTLPAGTAGDRAYVTDQLTACAAIGSALTGGGAVTCPAFYNGTAWVGG